MLLLCVDVHVSLCVTDFCTSQIISNILATPRKGLSGSCTTLISTLVTAHGASTTAMPPWMWRAALQALDPGVQACAGPGVSAPSQVSDAHRKPFYARSRLDTVICVRSVHEKRHVQPPS